MEQLILFGYASLFVSAFPLAPLICLLSNYIELRVDAITFLHYSARPLPAGASGIGAWGRFVGLVSFASCATNLGVTIFTNPEPLFGESDLGTRTAVFIVAEHVLLLSVFVIAGWIGDVPQLTLNRAARNEYLQAKHLKGDIDSLDDVLVASGVVPTLADAAAEVAEAEGVAGTEGTGEQDDEDGEDLSTDMLRRRTTDADSLRKLQGIGGLSVRMQVGHAVGDSESGEGGGEEGEQRDLVERTRVVSLAHVDVHALRQTIELAGAALIGSSAYSSTVLRAPSVESGFNSHFATKSDTPGGGKPEVGAKLDMALTGTSVGGSGAGGSGGAAAAE